MAKKRFTDIEIWDKEWYMDLSPKHKCLIKYIFDKCDSSGCWKPNWKLASLHIGEEVTELDLKKLPIHQYEILPNGKIFITDFINFQYGTLSKKSPAHNPVFLAIEKNNLSDRVFNRVSNNLKEKDKDKEEEKEEEEEEEGMGVQGETFLVPQMLTVFVKKVKGYHSDKIRDYEPTLSIAKFIANSQNLDKDVTKCQPQILSVWDKISTWISTDSFYSQKSLKTISTHIQEILNKSLNGTTKNIGGSKSNGREYPTAVIIKPDKSFNPAL